MKNYLYQLILNSKIKLESDNNDISVFKNLIEGTYSILLLFNKRRVGKLQRIPLASYLKHQGNTPSGEFEKLLSSGNQRQARKRRSRAI